MVNMKNITAALKSILEDNTSDYTIERNPKRNKDPNLAAKGNGWIGIYRGSVKHGTAVIGSVQPWSSEIRVLIEVQVASSKSGEDAEDRLEDAVAEVMGVLNQNKNIGGYVGMTNGYEVTYEYNADAQIWHHGAIITIIAEVRS